MTQSSSSHQAHLASPFQTLSAGSFPDGYQVFMKFHCSEFIVPLWVNRIFKLCSSPNVASTFNSPPPPAFFFASQTAVAAFHSKPQAAWLLSELSDTAQHGQLLNVTLRCLLMCFDMLKSPCTPRACKHSVVRRLQQCFTAFDLPPARVETPRRLNIS